MSSPPPAGPDLGDPAPAPVAEQTIEASPRRPRRNWSTRGRAGELAAVLALAFGLAWLVQGYVVKPFQIPSVSMEHTLKPGDRVLVARFAYDFSGPSRGDVIVFHPPGRGDNAIYGAHTKASVDYVKRVVGLPGDWVEAYDRHVYICTGSATGCRVLHEPWATSEQGPVLPTHVPKNCYFVMGDNRSASDDSRIWGCVPRANIVGEAFAVYWPIGRLGLL